MFPKRTDPVTGKVKYATGEVRARIGLINNTTGFKTIGTFSERLWSDQVADIGTEAYTDLDFADAIEQVLLSHNGTASMVEDLIEKYYQESPMEREPSPEDIFYAEQQESANEDQEIDEIWDYFGDKEKDIEAEDQYIRDENGNILFQKTDMTPTSGESIAERIHKIKCP